MPRRSLVQEERGHPDEVRDRCHEKEKREQAKLVSDRKSLDQVSCCQVLFPLVANEQISAEPKKFPVSIISGEDLRLTHRANQKSVKRTRF
jgi:hypothetical protein